MRVTISPLVRTRHQLLFCLFEARKGQRFLPQRVSPLEGTRFAEVSAQGEPWALLRLVLLLSDVAVDEIVKRLHPSLFQECSELHVTSDFEISVVLLLDRPDVCVVAFVSKQAIFIARSLAAHARCIFCHSHELQMSVKGVWRKDPPHAVWRLGSYEETPSLIAVIPRIEIAIAILDATVAAKDPAESRRSRTLAISRHS